MIQHFSIIIKQSWCPRGRDRDLEAGCLCPWPQRAIPCLYAIWNSHCVLTRGFRHFNNLNNAVKLRGMVGLST